MLLIPALALQVFYCAKSQAQFVNGDKEIKARTIVVADSLLRNQLIKISPQTVIGYLNDANKSAFVNIIKLPVTGKTKIDAETIYLQSKNAVGWVAMCYRKRFTGPLEVNAASAFVITAGGICLTNYHVIFAFAHDKGLDGSGAFMVRLGNGKIYQLKKIIAASKEDDIAILQLDVKPGEQLPYLSIEKETPKIGEDLFMLGNPQDMYYSFTRGIVSNLYADGVSWPDGSGGSVRDLMAITADFAIGASGSPIINKNGNVIGMVSSTHTIEQNKSGYQLTQMVIKNAIPNRSLLKILQSVNVE
ncbi:S1C family serine protease [Pedobacter petrophilus]|nr:serine protease [Pedobacter petrophilus]